MTSIRPIRPDEGPELRRIRLQALAESPAAFGSTLAETEARPRHYWDERVQQNAAGLESIMFVAEGEEGWVGLVGGYVNDDTGSRDVELISMWVNPAYRGHGLGQQLVESLVEWARQQQARRVTLWVTESNAPAISLYRRCGFSLTGETQAHPSQAGLREKQLVLEL